MAEIKSAVELAMERTKNMIPSDAEKEKIREEEDASRAAALVNRFLYVDLHFKDLDKELAKYDPADRTRMARLMMRHLGEAISLEGDHDIVFEGVVALQGSPAVLSKIRDLKGRYGGERVQEVERVREGLRGKLKERGISGGAVQPKVEGSPEWKEAESRFKPGFEKQLALLVAELQK